MTAKQIFAAINEALEQGANWKEEQMQQRIKELEMQLEIAAKDANAAWMYNRNANEKIKELEEKQGKFAEWASGEGWQWVDNYVGKHWVKGFDWDMQTRTTPELWAEFDKRNDNDGSNRHE